MVACVQDGIAGEYVTATGRLFEIFFILAAVVSGIGITLYAAIRLGVPLRVENVPGAPLVLRPEQFLGAIGVTVSFAVALLVPPRYLIPAAIGGGVAWTVFVQLHSWQVPTILATAISAAVVGLFGTAYTRHVRVPSMVITIPAIGTLLPGTALYRGMLEVSLGHGDAGLVQPAAGAVDRARPGSRGHPRRGDPARGHRLRPDQAGAPPGRPPHPRLRRARHPRKVTRSSWTGWSPGDPCGRGVARGRGCVARRRD